MRRLGLALMSLVFAGAFVASCEQQMVVVDRDGGGGHGGDADEDGSAEYVASSSVVTTVSTTGVIVECGNAPAPQGEVTPCETVSAASSGTAMLCLSCVEDEGGQQYWAQCLGQNCHCSVGEQEFCSRTVESETCGESACPYPWGPF
ncbi:MAG: hypothetical protein HOV80_27695 [Polyangiaceae bacterium]|nr:hypothetical protein [Polyangiaceae bacterium]